MTGLWNNRIFLKLTMHLHGVLQEALDFFGARRRFKRAVDNAVTSDKHSITRKMATKSADHAWFTGRSTPDIIWGNRVGRLELRKVPLVLVSQIQRSGGTLLSQLLDGHPQVLAHPSELYLGQPNKYFWPDLDLAASPETWFDYLKEPVAEVHALGGYHKNSPAGTKSIGQNFHPFVFLQSLQQEIFVDLLVGKVGVSQRDILDAYITSYFGAWLDYQHAYRQSEKLKYWSGFAPRLMTDKRNRELFFRDYPDGYWVAILRDPISWYASASAHQPDTYGDVKKAVQLWTDCYQSVLDGAAEWPDRVVVLSFETLVHSTEDQMVSLSSRLGIDFGLSLLQPTFNTIPILADSSFEVAQHGVLAEPANRSGFVDERAQTYIQQKTEGLYTRVAELIQK